MQGSSPGVVGEKPPRNDGRAAPTAATRLLSVADLAGVLVFSVEGAMSAAAHGLDVLGILVLAFATALGGGIIRDLLIGEAPPAAIRSSRYGVTALTGGAVVLLLHAFIGEVPPLVLTVLDAAGLSLFAVAGAEKALIYRIGPLLAVLMGAITGVGGGIVRDLLLVKSPSVLHADVYASAAIIGAAAMILGRKVGVRPWAAATLGALLCFAVRLLAAWRHWNLPKLV